MLAWLLEATCRRNGVDMQGTLLQAEIVFVLLTYSSVLFSLNENLCYCCYYITMSFTSLSHILYYEQWVKLIKKYPTAVKALLQKAIKVYVGNIVINNSKAMSSVA